MKPTSTNIDAFIQPDLLESNCYLRETKEMPHYFSDEELQELKDRFFRRDNNRFARNAIIELVKELMNTDYNEDELRDAFAELTFDDVGETGKKEIEKELKQLRQIITQGYEMVDTILYGMDYQDIGRMAFYNTKGEYVYDRPLKAGEKQASIHSIHRTGTDL